MKFGLREVCNVVLKARKDGTFLGKEFKQGQPVLWFDSLKTSGLEGSGEIIYARGGRGNTKLVSWTGDREVTFTMEDALISPMSMALLTAGSLRKAGADDNKILSHMTETYNIVIHDEIDVEHWEFTGTIRNPSAELRCLFDQLYLANQKEDDRNPPKYNTVKCAINEPVSVSANGKSRLLTEKYAYNCGVSQDGSYVYLDIESFFEKDSVKSGDTISFQFDYYIEKTSNMIQIDISPDSFGAGFYLEGETLFREYGEGGYDQAAEFIVPNCRVQSNFNFSMASTGDPSTFTFTMDAFPAYLDLNSTAGNKVLCAIQVFEEEKKEGGN